MTVLTTPGFNLVSAQEQVDAYLASGEFAYAMRLLQAMLDMGNFDKTNGSIPPEYHWVIDESLSHIESQLNKVRDLIRSGV